MTIADRERIAQHAYERHTMGMATPAATTVEVYDTVNRRVVFRSTL